MSTPTEARTRRIVDLYRAFREDPDAVDPAWERIFRDLEPEARSWLESAVSSTNGAGFLSDHLRASAMDSTRALMLIRAYRVRGHLEADLDPLGLAVKEPHPELDPATYGFAEGDMDRPIYLGGVLGREQASMREILNLVRRDYCGTIGLEFMHLQDPHQKDWIQKRMEGILHRVSIKDAYRLQILERLTAAETFEKFLDKKYTGTKRFGLDGGEAALPALETIVQVTVGMGVEDIVIGMPHRGRLNVLANLMNKPLTAIFTEFRGGAVTPDEIGGSGDVKYHLGTSTDREIDGRMVHLSLTPNPSHLEAVDPVVVGKVRARQERMGDRERKRVMGLLMHGDAAFAGQGVVAETFQFCDLPGYRTGGTIHLIVNNQIGFTTNPLEGRSSPYCSDLAKVTQAPIVHVNGDDPEAVVEAARFAAEFRQMFQRDVVIDMVCYRRHGHNEGDEPAFTQPRMYRAIEEHPTTREIYARSLVKREVVTGEQAEKMVSDWWELLDTMYEASAGYKIDKADWLEGSWSGMEAVKGYDPRRGRTEAPPEMLREVGKALVEVPDGFHLNRKIGRLLRNKTRMMETGEGIDWATAEALAFGTLLLEGHPVRLSGEDSNRGTFSQRHASWVDQENEREHVPLNHIRNGQARFEILDSPLSEFGVLGFEYGYAMSAPETLVLWEAQFGDFANGAQVVIDQFISSGEHKWLRMSGVVLLLPHGYEGQGPEHSSARLERFLQLSAEDNIQVVNCTTPASYFHVLRRQLHRNFRKPLVVMTPKSLLRHKRCVSRLSDLGPGTAFRRVLPCPEPPCDPAEARQLVLMSGKVYYDLLAEREKRGIQDVHFLRLEQLYPFPLDSLAAKLEPYRHCRLVWCQEEPRNMGAWGVVGEVIEEIAEEAGCEHPRLRYAGRATSASPATGLHERHVAQQERLVDEALTVGLEPMGRIEARRRGSERKPKVL